MGASMYDPAPSESVNGLEPGRHTRVNPVAIIISGQTVHGGIKLVIVVSDMCGQVRIKLVGQIQAQLVKEMGFIVIIDAAGAL